MAVNFVTVNRETPDRFPASVQEYLPEDHPARFVVEIVDRLDPSQLVAAYAGTGSRPYHPAMLVALLFYGYATGVFSSRKLALATYDSIAFRYICANTHPDHRTIADFRKRFLDELAGLFTAVLLIAQAMGLLKLGTVSLDGTKIKANASKHKALSFAHANRLEEQLKGEVEELMRLAEQADNTPRPAPLDLPAELKRREQRLAVIAAAKAEIEARAQARFEAEHAEYERKLAEREARCERTGKKPGGKPPKAPEPGPRAKDQVNLTDAESRIMPTAGGGFEQAYNAQANVDTATHLIGARHVTDHTNDKQDVGRALERLDALPEALGTVDALLADTGYSSQGNLERCAAAGIDPYIPRHASTTIRPWPSGSPPTRPPPRPADAGRGQCPSAAHPRRQGPLCQAQGHGRDRLWHRQAGAGLPPISAARPACGVGRVGAGVCGMESQAPFCA